jgi:hypothetical protein
VRPALLLLATACGPTRYVSADECEAMKAGNEQDACWADTLPDLFRKERGRAEALTRTQITDPRIRDFVWLTVTREVDPGTMRYCDEIEEPALRERCRVLVSRPHLHRELTGKPPTPFDPGASVRPGAAQQDPQGQ